MHFATTPNSLRMDLFRDPSQGDGWWPEPHDEKFAVSDVFFAEVALLMLICRNGASILPTIADASHIFQCDYDRERVEALGAALMGGRPLVS